MNIVKSNCLTSAQIAEIRKLESIVNKNDNLSLSSYLDNEINFDKTIETFFLAYENDMLIGFLTVFIPTKAEGEISAFVHPKHRRKNVFKEMLLTAAGILKANNIPVMLFCIDSRSTSGSAALEHFVPNKFQHAEYFMSCNTLPKNTETTVKFETVTEENFADFEDVVYTVFPDIRDEDFCRATLTSDARTGFIGYVNGEAVTACGVKCRDEEAFIYCVATKENHRRKGYADALIKNALAFGLSKMPVAVLTVDTEGLNARHLYENNGFVLKYKEDYFEFKIEDFKSKATI